MKPQPCVKCGWLEYRVKFETDENTLVVTCGRCTYTWTVPADDSKQLKKEKDDVGERGNRFPSR